MGDLHGSGVFIVGVGNELRGDDGAGLEIARRIREGTRDDGIEVCELHADPTRLLDMWVGRDAVVLVDAMRSGALPGTILRLDASHGPLPPRHGPRARSTHAAGLAETIELARALGSLPARVIVYAVEGRRFDADAGLSDEIAAIVPAIAERIVREARALRADDGSLTGFSAT